METVKRFKNNIMKLKIFTLVLVMTATLSKAQTEFNRIACGSMITLYIQQGDSCTYKAKTESKDAAHRLNFEVYNNTLHIEGTDNTAYITMKELTGLNIGSGAKVVMEKPFTGAEMKLEFSGFSSSDLNIEATRLLVNASGASQVVINGKANDAEIEVSGASKVNAFHCLINKCEVNATGASTCVIDSVSDNLTVAVSGASKVYVMKVPETYVARRSGVGKIYEGTKEMDSTTIVVGDTKVIIHDEEVVVETDVKDGEKKQNKYMHIMGGGDAGFNWSGFDIGFNALLNGNNTTAPPPGYEYLDINQAISLQYNLNLLEKDFKIYKRYVMGMIGLGFSWNNYRFTGQQVLQPNMPEIYAKTDSTMHLNVNKLRVSYFNVPVMIGFNTSQKKSKSFHIAAGVVIGVRMNGMVKTTSDVNSYHKKTFATYNTNEVLYEGMLRLKYKWANVWVSYSLNGLFKQNEGPELHPVAVGVSLIEF
jgi:hypothetical protein